MAPLEHALAIPARGSDRPTLEVELLVRMMVAAEHLRRGVERVCDRHGLTLQQYKVLRFLSANPGGAPRCAVSRQCSHSSPDMTRLIDRLVRRRLVVRTRNPEDGRIRMARLTRSGAALLEALDPLVQGETERALAPLSDADRRELSRLCWMLIA